MEAPLNSLLVKSKDGIFFFGQEAGQTFFPAELNPVLNQMFSLYDTTSRGTETKLIDPDKSAISS